MDVFNSKLDRLWNDLSKTAVDSLSLEVSTIRLESLLQAVLQLSINCFVQKALCSKLHWMPVKGLT